jgi:hypothetical protein
MEPPTPEVDEAPGAGNGGADVFCAWTPGAIKIQTSGNTRMETL